MPLSGIERRLIRPQTEQVDVRPDVLVARRAARQWGVLSYEELRECGLRPDAITVRVERGHLHRLHRGVYAVGHANLTLEGRFIAAVKACGTGALLSHYSAAALRGLVRWDDRYPEVTVPGGSTRRHGRIRVHRAAAFDPTDVAWHKGIPTTSPARTLVDLAAVVPYRPLRRAVREAQALKCVQLGELRATLARLGPRRGSRNLKRILATGPAPTGSELEDAVLDLILGAGFAMPDVNVPMRVGRRIVIPDFRWPRQELIIEADGAVWHDNRLAREDDAERQALLESCGEHVIRVTWEQAVAQPRQTLARIRAAGAPAEDG